MKIVFILAVFLALVLQKNIARAAFPDKPIIMIVPFSAGYDLDIEARTVANILEKELGAKVVVKNIPGAGGTLGAAELSKAVPDGYTIGYLSVGPLALQPQVRKLPYSAADFKPVACVKNTPMVFMVKKDSPMNTLADAKKFLLEQNGKAAFGSPGPGGLTHIASVALIDAMGAQAKHIPDLSIAENMKNISGDFIQFFADTVSCLNIYDVKALAIFSAERHPDFPNLPTAKEQGYDFEFSIFAGICAPKGTPDEVVAKLEQAIKTALASPGFKEIARKNSITIQSMGSAEFSEFIDQRVAVGKELINKFDMKQK